VSTAMPGLERSGVCRCCVQKHTYVTSHRLGVFNLSPPSALQDILLHFQEMLDGGTCQLWFADEVIDAAHLDCAAATGGDECRSEPHLMKRSGLELHSICRVMSSMPPCVPGDGKMIGAP
jgi:hypothetical protein